MEWHTKTRPNGMPPNGSYSHFSSVSLDGSHAVCARCVVVGEAGEVLCWGGCAVMRFVVGMGGIWMFVAIMLCVEEETCKCVVDTVGLVRTNVVDAALKEVITFWDRDR
jgi:hypothetical protein